MISDACSKVSGRSFVYENRLRFIRGQSFNKIVYTLFELYLYQSTCITVYYNSMIIIHFSTVRSNLVFDQHKFYVRMWSSLQLVIKPSA